MGHIQVGQEAMGEYLTPVKVVRITAITVITNIDDCFANYKRRFLVKKVYYFIILRI